MLTRYVTLTALITTLCLITALSIFTGCQGVSPTQKGTLLDRNWGKSFEAAKNNQILNPDAGKHLEPVEGLDGVASEMNTEKYRKAFKDEPSTQIYNLNLGNISGIGQK